MFAGGQQQYLMQRPSFKGGASEIGAWGMVHVGSRGTVLKRYRQSERCWVGRSDARIEKPYGGSPRTDRTRFELHCHYRSPPETNVGPLFDGSMEEADFASVQVVRSDESTYLIQGGSRRR
jgi:hypothetical protein